MMSLTLIPLIFTSWMFLSCSHPISMTISIIASALVMSVHMGMTISSSWPAYILFLIYLGGMLVVFSYIASIAPNSPLLKTKKLITSMITGIPALFLLLTPNFLKNPIHTEILNINKMFSSSMFPLTIMMISFLLLALLSISSMLKMNSSPLKMFN